MGIGTPSGTYNWNPAVAEFVLESFERIQIFAPALEDRHLISARRSANFILSDYANRGINLWTVEPLAIPLIADIAEYDLPANTVDLLDCYLSTFGTGTPMSLGHALTVLVTGAGDPILTQQGEPILIGPQSGVFSTIAGDQTVRMFFPSHGQSAGSFIQLMTPVTMGPMTVYAIIVSRVIDQNNLEFLAPMAAPETRTGTGGTPLFVTKLGSASVTVVLAGHGLSVGDNFQVGIKTAVGGLSLFGSYEVTSLPTPSYSFTIQSLVAASANAVAFENHGQIPVATQAAGTQNTSDIMLQPISRNNWANLPNKKQHGRPTSYWFNRQRNPGTITVWPVPPTNSTYGFVGFRTRYVQDVNLGGGETPEIPKRFYLTFVSDLTSALAEKFKHELFEEKIAVAESAWDRAQAEDREKVTTSIVPAFGG